VKSETERTALLLATAIVAIASMSIDIPPFSPIEPQPDYAATMAEASPSQADASQNVIHHGQWTKIDRRQGSSSSTTYYSAIDGVRINVSGRGVTLERRAGSDFGRGIDAAPRNTTERQTLLGESCTVWNVWRTMKPVFGAIFSHLNCITDDGVTLWEKTLHGNEVTATVEASHIERRPVSPDEVRPSRELLALDWWDADFPSFDGPSEPDHEVVMELADGGASEARSIMTRRRLGPWYFQDQVIGARRNILISHDSHHLQFSYSSDPSGRPRRLEITRADRFGEPMTRKPAHAKTDLNRSETILGETCRWFDMMPHTYDASRLECLTSDDIALKEVVSGRLMGTQTWTAIRLSRRPIKLDEIKPPAELLTPQYWGYD